MLGDGAASPRRNRAIARVGELLELATELGRDDHAQMRRAVIHSHLCLSAATLRARATARFLWRGAEYPWDRRRRIKNGWHWGKLRDAVRAANEARGAAYSSPLDRLNISRTSSSGSKAVRSATSLFSHHSECSFHSRSSSVLVRPIKRGTVNPCPQVRHFLTGRRDQFPRRSNA